jgi:hypothetical protein
VMRARCVVLASDADDTVRAVELTGNIKSDIRARMVGFSCTSTSSAALAKPVNGYVRMVA